MNQTQIMQQMDHLHGNYLDVLADASSVVSVIDAGIEVLAVVTLAEFLLCAGSSIDVYCDGLFWEAEILVVEPDRFRFRFLYGVGKSLAGGWVWRRDFLSRWRFPVRVESDVWKAKLVSDSIIFHHD